MLKPGIGILKSIFLFLSLKAAPSAKSRDKEIELIKLLKLIYEVFVSIDYSL
jgi:hypothetical protein